MKMTKKLISAVLVLFTGLSCLFAERMVVPRRYVELGVDTQFGFSNNYFGLNHILTKNITFDLPKISSEMSDQGIIFDTNVAQNFWLDVNFGKMQFRFSEGIESNIQLNVFKGLIDFLAKGNKLNAPLDFGGTANGSAYMFFDTTFGYDISGWRFSVRPAVFVPLVHARTKQISANFPNAENGELSFDINIETDIYTGFDSSNITEDFSADKLLNMDKATPGFDIELSLEHQIVRTLQGQIFIRCPIVPGGLHYKANNKMTYTYSGPNVLTLIMGKSNEYPEYTNNASYGSDDIFVNRPFHTGIRGAWRPFGNWCTFRGMIGFGVENPFSAEASGYMEFEAQADILLINIFGFTYTSSYHDKIFTQSLGIAFNFRVLELDFGIGVQGADFLKSFTGTGVIGAVGIKLGF